MLGHATEWIDGQTIGLPDAAFQEPFEAVTPVGESVLVVDDSLVARSVVAASLRRAGYRVLHASRAEEAIAVYEEHAVPVVITAVDLPGTSGIELLRRLRASDLGPEVILLTPSRSDEALAAAQALRLGAHACLAKDAAVGDPVVLATRRAAEKCRLRVEIAALMAELQRRSLADALTALGNRRAFDEAVAQEIARARRSGTALGLAVVDVDGLRHVNDALGRPAGDEAITAFAERLRAIVRRADRVFRYEGGTFAVLLGEAPLEGVLGLARRVILGVAGEPFAVGAYPLRLTCSVGAAALDERDDAEGGALLRRAMDGLRAAKQAGRNCTRAAAAERG